MLSEPVKNLSELIDQACCAKQQKPNLELNDIIAETIISQSDLEKDAVRLLKRKLALRDSKAVYLALMVTEKCMKRCGISFWEQVGTKEFMGPFYQLSNSRDMNTTVSQFLVFIEFEN